MKLGHDILLFDSYGNLVLQDLWFSMAELWLGSSYIFLCTEQCCLIIIEINIWSFFMILHYIEHHSVWGTHRILEGEKRKTTAEERQFWNWNLHIVFLPTPFVFVFGCCYKQTIFTMSFFPSHLRFFFSLLIIVFLIIKIYFYFLMIIFES